MTPDHAALIQISQAPDTHPATLEELFHLSQQAAHEDRRD